MNKTAIKNFAIWARNKLIADISYRAGLMGITADGIKEAVMTTSGPTGQTGFYDIGTTDPFAITGESIQQRRHLVDLIRTKEKETDYKTAYKYVIEEVAYTWFNRLIAVRFMEVNDYLPSHIRVLSSETGKLEPDLVTTPFDAELEFTRDEQKKIIDLKSENKLDDLFRMLFIKQCNALNEILPALFEKTDDYTELLLNMSVIDQDGVVYRLIHDIPEEDFDIERGGQVEIIGWLYQYYNTEPKSAAFAKKGKITKEEIPAVTQLFTPDWIVRYMVENSVGRLWIEHLRALDEFADEAALAADFGWKYYLPEAKQEPEVEEKLRELRKARASLTPDQITMIDPCMGSGHILVYGFSVLMQIYESAGYGQRDAAKSILEHNLFGLDIDDRAYQMAYFAVMMKAREYNRRILNGESICKVYAIQDSNGISDAALGDMGENLSDADRKKALKEMKALITEFKDAKEYGSILNIEKRDWELLHRFAVPNVEVGQLSLDMNGTKEAAERLQEIIDIAEVMTNKYAATVTNPPYMGNAGFSPKLSELARQCYPDSKNDLYSIMMERCAAMASTNSYVSMITMQSWVNAPTFKNLRKRLFSSHIFVSINNMGSRAFDEIQGEKVKNVVFVYQNKKQLDYVPKFVDLTSVSGELEKRDLYLRHEQEYEYSKQSDFLKHDLCLIVYKTRHVKDIYSPEIKISDVSEVRRCIATGNDDQFIRLWYEVDVNGISPITIYDSKAKWFFISNGGERRRWYGNIHSILNWKDDGADIRAFNDRTGKATLRNVQYMFQEGITYTYTSMGSGIFNARSIYSGMGSIGVGPVLVDNKDTIQIFALINSVVFRWFWDSMYGKVSTFETGNVGRIAYKEGNKTLLENAVRKCVEIAKKDWDSFELSRDFLRHPLITGKSIKKAYADWTDSCNRRISDTRKSEEEMNRHLINIYNLQDELDGEVKITDVTIRSADLQRENKSLISYAIGCMFGRYSLDVEGLTYAGGDWDSRKYESFITDADNIIPITDEEYLEDDVVTRLCEWLKVAYGVETLEENLDFIANAIGNKGNSSRETIRNYFLNDFYKDHCQVYSVIGSGKRPIYWLFDSGKQNGFKALIYLHRYTPDTIGNLRIDYLHRMQRIYESEINRMQDMIDHSTNAREIAQATKRKEKLTKQLKECREYDEKLAHLALSRIELDLDDGVKVNYRKIQTANDGKFYEVLADSKNIMAK